MKTLAALALALALMPPSLGAQTRAVVLIENMRFVPSALELHRGDTVVWHNRDVVPHTATASGRFDSGVIAPGASWSWTPQAPGRYEYACSLHPDMTATLEVK